MDYNQIIKQCEENSKLISMISVEEILRFGYSIGLNEDSRVVWNVFLVQAGVRGSGIIWVRKNLTVEMTEYETVSANINKRHSSFAL